MATNLYLKFYAAYLLGSRHSLLKYQITMIIACTFPFSWSYVRFFAQMAVSFMIAFTVFSSRCLNLPSFITWTLESTKFCFLYYLEVLTLPQRRGDKPILQEIMPPSYDGIPQRRGDKPIPQLKGLPDFL